MKQFLFAGAACAALLSILAPSAHAHGGQYRGPTDIVPPTPGNGGSGSGPAGPTAPGPNGPSTPGPNGPSGPGPAGPSSGGPGVPNGGRPPTTRGGIEIIDDLTDWLFWWEINKDPYIRLKDAIHARVPTSGSDAIYLGPTQRVRSHDSMGPSDEDKLNVILPALKKAIDSTNNHDIATSCMVAMAKVGRNHATFKLRDVFLPRLANDAQEIRETAALAFGIAALPDIESLDVLIDLAKDTANGRRLTDRARVDDRTRSFATYGIGLVAHANAKVQWKRKAFDALADLLDDQALATNRNMMVATISAMGLLNPSPADTEGRQLIRDTLKALETYYAQPLGAGEQLMQSHVPPAVAKLLGTDYPDAKVVQVWKDLFVADLEEKGKIKRSSHDVARSCALALGQLCKPVDDEKAPDAPVCKLLLQVSQGHADHQTRHFAMLALGQIGGLQNRSTLLREFDKGNKAGEKPWIALAMGIFAFEKYVAQDTADQEVQIEEEFGRVLQPALEDIKNPMSQSALAVALGLCRYKTAADDLRSMLTRNKSKEDLAGYLCIGLALMGDERSKDEISSLVAGALRRPGLLGQGAVALGKLGDRRVAENLQQMMAENTNLATLSAIASALSLIGDRRSIAPLKSMLADESLTPLTRAFAAVALGGIGDKELLPWNSKIGANMNYRAAVETLTDRTSGILDIL